MCTINESEVIDCIHKNIFRSFSDLFSVPEFLYFFCVRRPTVCCLRRSKAFSTANTLAVRFWNSEEFSALYSSLTNHLVKFDLETLITY